MTKHPFFALATLALASLPAVADDQPKDPINNYLVNVGAGHVAANELIGLTGSAVSNLQTPKDLVAALSSLGDSSSKNGFGVAWAPGRSSMKLMGVSASDYDGNALKRLWASTTFSYAQNTKTVTSADYGQKAAAVNVVYYLNNDDPLLTQYHAFRGATKACSALSADFDAAGKRLNRGMNARQNERKAALRLKAGDDLPMEEVLAIEREFNEEAEAAKAVSGGIDVDGVRRIKQMKNDPSKGPALRAALATSLQNLDKCALEASAVAEKTWNASHLDFVLGQGWLRGEAAASPRISLGRHIGLALAWGLDDGLLNLTYRRISGEVDLDTLTKGLLYKGTSLAAMRYTYRMDDRPGKLTYALAEVSNAKSNSGTTSNTAFKWAFGVDRQVGENMWIEVRAGRARIPGGTAEENKALLNLKFSPEAGLPNAIKAAGS